MSLSLREVFARTWVRVCCAVAATAVLALSVWAADARAVLLGLGASAHALPALAALEGATPQQIAERSAGNLLPVPWIEPEDVAAAIVYLASDKARFITGSQFVLDAGLLTR